MKVHNIYILLFILISVSCTSQQEKPIKDNASKKNKQIEHCSLDTTITNDSLSTTITFRKKNCDCSMLLVLNENKEFVKAIDFDGEKVVFEKYYPFNQTQYFSICHVDSIKVKHEYKKIEKLKERIYFIDKVEPGKKSRFTINSSGFNPDNVSASCSGCKMLMNKGNYYEIVVGENAKKINIYVSVRIVEDGEQKTMSIASKKFNFE